VTDHAFHLPAVVPRVTGPMRRDDWLINQLPVSMVEDEFLVRFLRIFQDVAETVFHQIDNLPHMFDPSVAPLSMVRTLGGWVGLDWIDPSLDDERQRQIVTKYFSLLRWRGTKRGMRQLLELITESPATVEEIGGVYEEGETPAGIGHVVLRVARSKWASEADLLRIVRSELPAAVTFELYLGDKRLWPPIPGDEPPSIDARPWAPKPPTLRDQGNGHPPSGPPVGHVSDVDPLEDGA
jgi:phage tail-like protein